MKTKYTLKLTQPSHFYFVSFLTIGTLLLSLMIWSFYKEGQALQASVLQQTQKEAQQELFKALNHTLDTTYEQLQTLADWDEVHQQMHNPSYYFFWHDVRLNESTYFQPYYQEIELYNRKGSLLAPASPQSDLDSLLPEHIDTLPKVSLKFSRNHLPYVVVFHPIYQRDNQELLGYIGLALDIKQALFKQNQFFYLDKNSLMFEPASSLSTESVIDHIQFKAVENPVNAYLWELIQKFILELIVTLALVAGMVMLLLNKLMRSPLITLSNYLHNLKANPNSEQRPPAETFWLKELEEFKETLFEFHHNLQQTQTQLDQQNLIVWEQARRDPLTNIYNRRAFDEAWNEVIQNYHKHPIPTAFMLFDCDFFKALNDTYGHEIGDEVIRISAKVIQQALPLESPAYRIGGDEFAVIIQHRNKKEILETAEKCLAALSDYPFQSIGIKEKITFSIGISSLATQKEDFLTNLPRQADIAMYKAKQSHTSKIQTYNLMLETEASALVSNKVINRVVASAHTGKHIQLHFQPIVALNNPTFYYEALLRIEGEEGLIQPYEIFKVIERRRLEVEIDQQVILAAFEVLKSGQLPEHSGLSINLSGKTLLQPNLVSLFEPFVPLLQRYKVVIEITENVLIDHIEYAQKVLNKLRHQGFKIALDDFGSGYSSIRYLASMPVDIIKFDMSMSRALGSDSKTQQIIMATAEMIIQAGFDLVMEGIEDSHMLEQARLAGATHIQGYLLGKPSPQFISPPALQLP